MISVEEIFSKLEEAIGENDLHQAKSCLNDLWDYAGNQIDFNFYWEILMCWVSDFNPRVSVYHLRGLCERLTTITANKIGIDPIEALHCGKTPNTDFNLTPPSESQVKS